MKLRYTEHQTILYYSVTLFFKISPNSRVQDSVEIKKNYF